MTDSKLFHTDKENFPLACEYLLQNQLCLRDTVFKTMDDLELWLDADIVPLDVEDETTIDRVSTFAKGQIRNELTEYEPNGPDEFVQENPHCCSFEGDNEIFED